MFIYCTSKYKPIFCRLKPFDGTRLYNTCFRPVLPYTAKYGFIRHSGIYWTIAAQAEKQTDGIFSVLSGFSANMGIYPFFVPDCLKIENTAFSGILYHFPVLRNVPCLVSSTAEYYVNRNVDTIRRYYVNHRLCYLSHYVNRQDPQSNSSVWSVLPICQDPCRKNRLGRFAL